MKKYQVVGLGNSLVDVLLDISEHEFAGLGFERGTMRLVSSEEQQSLLHRFEGRAFRMVSGGSVANSVIAVAQLGGKGAFFAALGDDKFGKFYTKEFTEFGIILPNAPTAGGMTGTCAALITPDSERTMRTCLATSATLGVNHISPEVIADSEWLFIEGYVFSNGEVGQKGIKKAIEAAKKSGCKVAITCSESWVISAFEAPVREAIAQADLVFANEEEAKTLARASSIDQAFATLRAQIPNVAVTAGSRGALVSINGEVAEVAGFSCTPRDLTGAGDMFAGGILYGITHNVAPRAAARAANLLAKTVITQIGARVGQDLRPLWSEGTSNL